MCVWEDEGQFYQDVCKLQRNTETCIKQHHMPRYASSPSGAIPVPVTEESTLWTDSYSIAWAIAKKSSGLCVHGFPIDFTENSTAEEHLVNLMKIWIPQRSITIQRQVFTREFDSLWFRLMHCLTSRRMLCYVLRKCVLDISVGDRLGKDQQLWRGLDKKKKVIQNNKKKTRSRFGSQFSFLSWAVWWSLGEFSRIQVTIRAK